LKVGDITFPAFIFFERIFVMAISILDGVLRMTAMFHPELKTLIDVALKYQTQLEALEPIIVAADQEGPSAIAAAEKAAPDLAKAIHDFVNSMPAQAPNAKEAQRMMAVKKEAVTRAMFGSVPMSDQEQKTWLSQAAPETGGGG
jgi:hypothetical protein